MGDLVDEIEIQSAILRAFKAADVFHWRVPLGGRRVAGGVRAKNPMKGFPDIAGVVAGSGRLFVCEVKKPGGRLTTEQLEWRRRLSESGVHYILAYSVADAMAGYQAAVLEKDFPR